MDAVPNRRDARRVILDRAAQLSFTAAGRAFLGVPLANLSHGGCLALLPSDQARDLVTDTLLEDLTIHHPGIKPNPIRARIAWCMGSKDDTSALGIQFLDMESETRISLVATIDAAILDRADP